MAPSPSCDETFESRNFARTCCRADCGAGFPSRVVVLRMQVEHQLRLPRDETPFATSKGLRLPAMGCRAYSRCPMSICSCLLPAKYRKASKRNCTGRVERGYGGRKAVLVTSHPITWGPRVADHIVQGMASGDEFRTAPLWGLRQRIFFLHGGQLRNEARTPWHQEGGKWTRSEAVHFQMRPSPLAK